MRIEFHFLDWYIRPYTYWGRRDGIYNTSKCQESYKHTKFLCFTITTYE